MSVIIPENYKSILNPRQTQIAIKKVKDFFERDLAVQLDLTRVSAPLFVSRNSGLNDNLSGKETPVSFHINNVESECEIVHSLAKWKRYALKKYAFSRGEGLYTDMNAIRKDEINDNIHSAFVDQWDWELIISEEDRNIEYLKQVVKKIYAALRHTEKYISDDYAFAQRLLPEKIKFITSQELEDLYPEKTPKEREYLVSKEYGAVFIMKIGGKLESGKPHDSRSPDYDDWELNGDIIVYYDILDIALELSSMGIRVDKDSLMRQLIESNTTDRLSLPYHQMLINGDLPLTIGGGIGQSRICMFFLHKAHIGEVQSSQWDSETIECCKKTGVELL